MSTPPPPPGLSVDERVALCHAVGEEVVGDLRALFEAGGEPVVYDGFEPSGRVHIAQGVMKALNVNRLIRAGCRWKIWIADWFAFLNNKMDGDLEKIRTVGRYMIEVWKACGMDMDKVEFLWSSEEINRRPDAYWSLVMDISRRFSVRRVTRCATIMGRGEGDALQASQILYPCMQCADVFFLRADICQLGMDQRKVNMLALEYAGLPGAPRRRPAIVSHHMLLGLKEGQAKMSKSDPDSAIFMEDASDVVASKIKKAYCPPGVVRENPVLDYAKHIVFPSEGTLTVKRRPAHGGDKTFATYDALAADYSLGLLHPGDLKPAVRDAINRILEPVRQHFATDPDAKKLLASVRLYTSTPGSS